jgi:hypothetical protein
MTEIGEKVFIDYFLYPRVGEIMSNLYQAW